MGAGRLSAQPATSSTFGRREKRADDRGLCLVRFHFLATHARDPGPGQGNQSISDDGRAAVVSGS